ncbi:MAG: hypothetical protein AAF587_01920 [Bacteroidota bacterium]
MRVLPFCFVGTQILAGSTRPSGWLNFQVLPLIMLSIWGTAFPQVTRTDGFVDANQGRPHSIIQEVPFIPSEYEGSFYIQDEWATGDIHLLSGDSLVNYPLKYDLEQRRMEIRAEKEVRILGQSDISHFHWLNELTGVDVHFVNARDFEFQGVQMDGMLELLVDGDQMKLLSLQDIIIQQGTYNRQIDIGDRTPRIVKKESFFLFHSGTMFKLNHNKRKTLLHFRGKSESVLQYAKKHGLGFKKRADLIELVAFFHSLP